MGYSIFCPYPPYGYIRNFHVPKICLRGCTIFEIYKNQLIDYISDCSLHLLWTSQKEGLVRLGKEALRNDIKSCGKISIFSKLKIDPETPPHPLSLV